MLVETKAAFLEVLDKSRLLSESQLAAARQLGEQEADPVSLAKSLIRDGLLNRWQAYHLLKGRYALSLGKYKFLDQIEVGGQHRMYLAQHPQLGRKVAIKTLSRRHALQDPGSVERFLAQARKLGGLEHRSILRVYDVDVVDQRCFLVMEHVDGKTLQDLLQDQGPQATERAAGYVAQAARGLAYAHQQQVVHGNLCPANLIVDDLGELKIANLGLSGLAVALEDESAADIRTSRTPPEYVAPERAEDETPPAPPSDVYALGAVLFALLTGKPPAPGSAGGSLRDLRPDVPPDLAAICQRSLAPDPAERYATVAEVAEALEPWVGDAGPAKAAALAVGVPSQPAKPPISATAPPAKEPSQREEKPAAEAAADDDLARRPPDKASPAAPERSAPPDGALRPEKSSPSPQEPVSKPAAEVPSFGGASQGAADALPNFAIDVTAKRPRTRPARSRGGESPPRKRVPKAALIAAGATVAGLAVLTVVGFLILSLFSRGEQQPDAPGGQAERVVSASDAAPAEDDPAAADLESDPLPAETDPIPSAAAPLAQAAPETMVATSASSGGDTPASAGAERAGSAAAGVDSPPTPAGERDAPAASAVPLAAEADAPSTPASQPAAEPPVAEPQAAADLQPAAESESAAEPQSAAEPEPEPPAPAMAETAPSEAEPAAAAAEAKPAPATPDKKPFADMPAIVSLPALDAANALEPVSLGKVYAGEELCFVRLRGGENAVKGGQTFAMRNAEGGLAPRDWELILREGSAGSEVKIAHLALGDRSDLNFQWQPAAMSQSLAANLVNCALSFTCRGESHVTVLREPVRVPPVNIDWQQAVIKQDWPLERAPDPGSLRLEILKLGGPKYSVEPQPVISADRGEAWIKLTDAGDMLSLKVETDLRRDFQITITPHVRFVEGDRPEKLNAKRFQQLKQQVVYAAGQAKNYVTEFRAAKDRAPGDKKRAMEQQLQNLEAEQRRLEEGASALERLDKLLKEAKPQLSARVFYDADGSEVTLLQAGS